MKVYPRIAEAAPQDRVLIVAPHVDDEAIGAAGYALDAISNGAEVYVVFLTAGDCNRFSARLMNRTLGPTSSDYLSVGRTRISEAHAAMRLMGVPTSHYFILGYPDRGLRAMLENRDAVISSRGTLQRSVPYKDAMSPGAPYTFDSVMADLQRVFQIARPTVVIAPVSFDLHPDHSAAAEMTDMTIGTLPLRPHRLGYLVHASRIPMSLLRRPERPLVPPTRMRRLDWATYPLSSAVLQKKDALLQTYKSQRPYTAFLRNAFVRRNELFFVYREQENDAPLPGLVASVFAPRAAIAR